MKRILTLLLTVAMTVSLAMPAQAANNTQASTMRLMETEGNATVENAIGKKLTIQDKMRLYNGYEVSTKKASYAYISLDNSKAVKLDSSSSVTVNQAGKKLELDVTAGELFFNVPVALKSDESLNIRSSTMVTGIRGTAGWIDAMDRYTTRIGVLEGAVTIRSQDPFTGADRSVTITGGQIATIIRHERANAIQQQLIADGVIIEENIVAELTKPGQIVEELQEDNVPGFVAAEVAKDDELRNRINEESPLDADEIANNADNRLLADQMAADKNDPETNDYNKDQESIFGEPEIIYVTVTKPGAPVQDPILDTEDPDVDEIQESLDELDVATVTNVDDLDLSELDFDEDDVLNIVSGTAIVGSGSAADIAGTVNVFADATLTNSGTIAITSTDSLHIYGTVINEGTINIGTPQVVEETPEGDPENAEIGDEESVDAVAEDSADTLAEDGETDTDSTASQSSPGKLVVENAGTLTNNGTITISEGSEFIVLGNYEDTVNEVFSQDENGVVTYLGSFAAIAKNYDNYSGKTFKLLDTETLTVENLIDCAASTEITLDLNGRFAEVNGVVRTVNYESLAEESEDSEESDVTDSDLTAGSSLFFCGDYDIEVVAEDGEEDVDDVYYTNFTLIDSVGKGTLAGSLILENGASAALESGTVNGFVFAENYGYFEMTGGTLVVPSYTVDDPVMAWAGFWDYCAGVALYYGRFYMNGGMIDASADRTCAIDAPLEWLWLESGSLIGQYLLPDCEYYEAWNVYASGRFNFANMGKMYGICSVPYPHWDGGNYPAFLCYPYEYDENNEAFPVIFRSDLITLYPEGPT